MPCKVYILVIPALGRWEQKNEEFRSQQGLYKTMSQKPNNNKQTKEAKLIARIGKRGPGKAKGTQNPLVWEPDWRLDKS